MTTCPHCHLPLRGYLTIVRAAAKLGITRQRLYMIIVSRRLKIDYPGVISEKQITALQGRRAGRPKSAPRLPPKENK